MSDKKYFAAVDLLIDGEHVDAGEPVSTDADTEKALSRSGRLITDAKTAKAIRDGKAAVKAAQEVSAQDAKVTAFLKLADELGIELPQTAPASEGPPPANA